MCSHLLLKYLVHAKVDLLTVTAAELHTRLVKFGSKHVGSTFQDAMMDPNFMDYVLKWMKPKSFEEELFKKYVKLVLEDFKPTAEASSATFQKSCFCCAAVLSHRLHFYQNIV